MANPDFRSGLSPLRNVNGSFPAVREMTCTTPVIYEGAPLLLSSDGTVAMATTSILTSTLAKRIVGVAQNGKLAGAGRTSVNVYVDPDQLWVIQSDDNSLNSIADFIGANFQVLNNNAGDSGTLRSQMEIDGSSASSTTASSVAALLQVVDSHIPIDGDLTSNGKFVVRINPKFHLAANNGGI